MVAVSPCREVWGSFPVTDATLTPCCQRRGGCWVLGVGGGIGRFPIPNVPVPNTHPGPGTHGEPPGNREEGGDDDKSARLRCPGLHTCYSGRYRGSRTREGEEIPKSRSRCGLQSAMDCMKLESLVTADQRCGGEYVLRRRSDCQPRPPRYASSKASGWGSPQKPAHGGVPRGMCVGQGRRTGRCGLCRR